MSDKETFEGWKNRETWIVFLYLTNEKYNAKQCKGFAESVRTEIPKETDTGLGRRKLSALLIEETNGGIPEDAEAMYADLLRSALLAVDWYAIAGHFLDQLDKDE